MGAGPAKPLRALAGRPLIAHVVAALDPQVRRVAIATRDLDVYRAFGVSAICDAVASDTDGRPPGPLAGILAALEWARRPEIAADRVLVAPADTPFLPRDLASRLFAEPRDSVAIARSGGREHYAIGLWPVALAEALRRAVVVEGQRSVGAVLRGVGYRAVDWPVGDLDPFENVNTPGDLLRAEAALRRARS